MAKQRGASSFWDDFESEMENPEFRDEFLRQHARTLTVDRIVNALEDQRETLGVSKADLARHLRGSPPAVRRLLTATNPNPTLVTLVDVAGALGLRLTLEPIPPKELADAPPVAASPKAQRRIARSA
ncbi:MAG: helix-turn-helix domain-containing protein [Actinobacteria bacterium]|nr:helix-turn-helix domain-containing protein [Actinomycetota bacterium]